MNRNCWRQILGSLWSILVVLHAQPTLAQAESQNKTLEVMCLTERPAIVEGESTSLQTWATTQDGQPLVQPASFVWQLSEGTVQGTGAEVQWNLSGVRIPSGELHKKVAATAKATATGLGDATCVVEVFIGKKEEVAAPGPTPGTRGGLRSARRFLLPDEKEETGFGLYSYLLFPAPPGTDEEKARYLKTLESCLRLMESVEDHLKRHRRPSELNATHIPVKTVPQHSKVLSEWAANVLSVYDYATAQKLLDKLEKTYQRGPYLISVLKDPLSKRTVPVQEHLLQDFTGKVPELVSQVVDLFTYRAAQQRTWTDESFGSFRLSVRNLVAVAGKVTPDVASAMISLVQASRAR